MHSTDAWTVKMEVAKKLASGNLKFYPNSSLLGRKASPRTMQLVDS